MEKLDSLLAKKETLEKVISRTDIWLVVVGVIVVVGVAGESIFGIIAWLNNRRLQKIQHSIDVIRQEETAFFNKQAADANKEAAEANKNAAEANKTAEGLRLDIARANETAETEKLARLQLEARLADRMLTPDQQRSISGSLKKVGTFSVQMCILSDSSEVAHIGATIESVLKTSGWSVKSAKYSGDISVKGVVLAIRRGGSGFGAATVLRDNLMRNGIETALVDEPIEEILFTGTVIGDTDQNAQINIFIGSK